MVVLYGNIYAHGTSSKMMQVFPNPIIQGQSVSIDIDKTHFSDALNIYITDVIGNIVYKEKVSKSQLNQTLFVDTDILSVGIYFIRVSDDSKELTKKLVIQ